MLQKDILRVHVIILQHFEFCIKANDRVNVTALIALAELLKRACLISLETLFIIWPRSLVLYLS